MSKQIERGVSIERLRELLDYDPETGALTWTMNAHPKVRGTLAGSPAGDLRNRKQVSIMGVRLYTARACFAHHHGRWPDHQIDHINHDSMDDRAVNLREATHQQNQRNRRSYGQWPKGVNPHPRSGRFRSRIRIDGRLQYLGTYDTAADAHAAYVAAATTAGYGDFLQA